MTALPVARCTSCGGAPEAQVWVASIDLGRGVLEPVHVFADAGAAEDYRAWKETTGDRCYIAEVPVKTSWKDAA